MTRYLNRGSWCLLAAKYGHGRDSASRPAQPVGHVNPDYPSTFVFTRGALAELLQEVTGRYDGLFGSEMPYSMGWHGAPTSAADASFQLHGHFTLRC